MRDYPAVFGGLLIIINCSLLSFGMEINVHLEQNPQNVTVY
jgi:hypothetical protein